MAVDTEIPGSPGSIRSAADWLQRTLVPAVGCGGDVLAAARREAAAEWRGEAGAAFCEATTRAVTQSDHVRDAVRAVRTTFDDYADALEACQQRMGTIREDARTHGLAVDGFTIRPPGEASPHPGRPATAAAVEDPQEQVRAYHELAARADQVRSDLERAGERVSAQQRALDGPTWTLDLAGIAGGLAAGALRFHGSILRDTSRYFADLADTHLARLAGQGRVPSAAGFQADWDHFSRMRAGAAADGARAARFLRAGRVVGNSSGGLLTGVGIWYDMEHGGESAGQAVTSNVGGFAASVAAGAAIGSFGGPVGTVAGVVVGAGVGVFTSGMIDGLWENGGDVGDAARAGLDTALDTGDALLDGAGDVGGALVDGVGGLLDRVDA